MTDLHPRTHLRAAAWVPDDDPHRDWAAAANLAADWIWQRSEIEGVSPVLVTNAQEPRGFGIDALDEIARAGGRTTPQSRSRPGPAPVLVYVPYEGSLQCAMDQARGFSLVAVETKRFSLAEWAAGAEAINLLTGKTSSSAIPDDVRDDLDSVMFDGGSNGWTGPDEKAYAHRHLAEHVRTRRLTSDQAASYVMSQGASDTGAKQLRELLEKDSRPRR
jgi:hypothetical protein